MPVWSWFLQVTNEVDARAKRVARYSHIVRIEQRKQHRLLQAGRQDDLLVRLDYVPVVAGLWIVAQIPGQRPIISGRYSDGSLFVCSKAVRGFLDLPYQGQEATES